MFDRMGVEDGWGDGWGLFFEEGKRERGLNIPQDN